MVCYQYKHKYLIKINYKIISYYNIIGEYKNDKADGIGEYRWKNGDIFRGIKIIIIKILFIFIFKIIRKL
jgi:hypothetical protein